jgi:hypothetical protein
MALDLQIARLSKILVDSDGITFNDAQTRLRKMTLEIVVGADAISPAAHAAILTAVSVGSRTFVGGVRVRGEVNQLLNSALPLKSDTLANAATEVGASQFEGSPSRRLVIGKAFQADEVWTVSVWWRGWRAGTGRLNEITSDGGENPLSGIAAGALGIGKAFEAERGARMELSSEVDLWALSNEEELPAFNDVFLPGAIWLIGLGNLGQAFLWALAALPYTNPSDVSLMLQDRDIVTEENWATSVLVKSEVYGMLKTKVGEEWALAKKFNVRRTDRNLLAGDRLENQDPLVAFCGVDKVEARKLIANVGFDCIVDAGLGRTSSDFDRYRITVFDSVHPIDEHFEGQTDSPADELILNGAAYQELEAEVGRCGTAKVAGASVAVPYVSAIAAAAAVSRLIAVASGCSCRTNEVRRLSRSTPKIGPSKTVEGRGALHAGNPLCSEP